MPVPEPLKPAPAPESPAEEAVAARFAALPRARQAVLLAALLRTCAPAAPELLRLMSQPGPGDLQIAAAGRDEPVPRGQPSPSPAAPARSAAHEHPWAHSPAALLPAGLVELVAQNMLASLAADATMRPRRDGGASGGWLCGRELEFEPDASQPGRRSWQHTLLAQPQQRIPAMVALAAVRRLRGVCRSWRAAVRPALVDSLDLGPVTVLDPAGRSRRRYWWRQTGGAERLPLEIKPAEQPPVRGGRAAALVGWASEDSRAGQLTIVIGQPPPTAAAAAAAAVATDGVGGGGGGGEGAGTPSALPRRRARGLDSLSVQPFGDSEDEAGWSELSRCRAAVPWPWPDQTNINPPPIAGIPLPSGLGTMLPNLRQLWLGGLQLAAVPEPIRCKQPMPNRFTPFLRPRIDAAFLAQELTQRGSRSRRPSCHPTRSAALPGSAESSEQLAPPAPGMAGRAQLGDARPDKLRAPRPLARAADRVYAAADTSQSGAATVLPIHLPLSLSRCMYLPFLCLRFHTRQCHTCSSLTEEDVDLLLPAAGPRQHGRARPDARPLRPDGGGAALCAAAAAA
eukprot:SAG22_NODE_49_length_24620_cov_80.053587_18_plen_568_part_00